jgi:hypothetical protein
VWERENPPLVVDPSRFDYAAENAAARTAAITRSA